MDLNIYPIARSFASFVLPKKMMHRPGSGGSFSAEYCYSVWLRHYRAIELSKLPTNFKKIAELGPGDSLGVGIVALLCGAEEYHAFDVIEHTDLNRNIKVANDVAQMLIAQRDIPTDGINKRTHPMLEDFSFPESLKKLKKENILSKLEQIILALERKPSSVIINYVVPWHMNQDKITDMDLVFSQAVMEHVSDIDAAYDTMYEYLKKEGVMSHQIDFKGHEFTKSWDGHWHISKGVWKFLKYGMKNDLNRLPFSAHKKAVEKSGFRIIHTIPVRAERIHTEMPKTGFSFEEEDFQTSGALIICQK